VTNPTIFERDGGASRRDSEPISRRMMVVFLGLAIALVGSNLFLLYRSVHAGAELASLRKLAQLQVGLDAPVLSGSDLFGHPKSIIPGAGGTDALIFVFSQSCTVCNVNWPNWVTLLHDSGLSFQKVFVDLTDEVDESYANKYGIANSDILTRINGRTAIRYALRVTPETIVVGRDRKIRGVWTGALHEKDLTAITKLLRRN